MCTLVSRSSLSPQQETERKVDVSLKGLNSSSFHLRLDKRAIPGARDMTAHDRKCRKSVQTLAKSDVSGFNQLISTLEALICLWF